MANTTDLFPILPLPRVNGLGRMAQESEHLDAGHDVDFRSLAVRSILNKSVSKRLHWMAWSINPYRGCEFGCRYCYARYTHEFLAPAATEPIRGTLADAEAFTKPTEEMNLRDPEAFERRIFAKQNAAWLLEQDLRRMAKQHKLHEEIALGTATDPWQPIERRMKITRSLLEVLARHEGLKIGMVTKATLIERDIDLLQQINERSTLVVHITITTPDVELARKLEPRAPRPDLRFETVRKLREAGIRTGILNCPLLPGITDTAEAIDRMAALAKSVGASFLGANPLFLKPCSRPTYFEFIREHFPHLQVLYMERFRDMDFASRPYRERLRALVKASCIRHKVGQRQMDTLVSREVAETKKPSHSATFAEAQGRLFA
ncbi:SPL family radical SAM protein [Terriglobus roseus]|uniref:DNA repair photolyase n=1 Tax=Terriglobus roseus TaxID=392734 RepID=A0A1G7LBE8_9BACT|nr:radical SAM protein [Terriglobus roseus]SDF46773.1 DNA repair photolyase [Terriglobus roseus]